MISEERIRRFWEWCGFRQKELGKRGSHYEMGQRVPNWEYPGETGVIAVFGHDHLPRIRLDSLFQWAVPKCQLRGEIVSLIALEHSGFECCIAYFVEPEPRVGVRNDDPATALFLAIEELIEEIG